MPRYDERIIVRYADELYERADGAVTSAAISGGIVGGLLGALLSFAAERADLGFAPWWLWVGAVGGIAAWSAASAAEREVFRLRLQAQEAMCQVQIERNSARAVEVLRRMADRVAAMDHRAALLAAEQGDQVPAGDALPPLAVPAVGRPLDLTGARRRL